MQPMPKYILILTKCKRFTYTGGAEVDIHYWDFRQMYILRPILTRSSQNRAKILSSLDSKFERPTPYMWLACQEKKGQEFIGRWPTPTTAKRRGGLLNAKRSVPRSWGSTWATQRGSGQSPESSGDFMKSRSLSARQRESRSASEL